MIPVGVAQERSIRSVMDNKNMEKVSLRKIQINDRKYFTKWWRDKTLIKLTSGILKRMTDQEIKHSFLKILADKNTYHFIIVSGEKVIGHLSLGRRQSGWHETQIVIGEKEWQGKGYGTEAIKSLIKKAKRLNITKIYLEVRPNNLRAIRTYEKCGFIKTGIKKYPKNKYLPQTLKMVLKNNHGA